MKDWRECRQRSGQPKFWTRKLASPDSASNLDHDGTHADIGLVCALPLELSDFLGRCTKVKKYTGGKFTFRGGFYGNIRIATVDSGPGVARARRATEALFEGHSPRWIVSTGFCGALRPEMKVGQIVVSNTITSTNGEDLTVDVGMTTDLARGLHVGKTVTVEQIIRTVAQKQSLAEQTGAIAVDMESHAVASVCHDRKTRFLAIRAISDDMSADLPAEVLSLMGETGAVRIGAAVGALWKRPSSFKEMWRLREHAMIASGHLASFLDGVVKQLHAS